MRLSCIHHPRLLRRAWLAGTAWIVLAPCQPHLCAAPSAHAHSGAPATDIGVLALPVRPAAKATAAASAPTPAEADEAAQAQQAEGSNTTAQDQPRKVIPAFYGDFAPAASRIGTREVPSAQEEPAASAPEPPSSALAAAIATPRVQKGTSLLAYDRTQDILRRLVPSASTINTDYRTRPANCEIPLTVRGRGLGGGRDLPIGGEDAWRDRLPPDYTPTDLVLVPAEWCYANQPIYLRREAAESLMRMLCDAQRAGLTLRVVSGYRDYGHQQRLYRQNGGSRGAHTVGQPGKSEHMLGTTVDFTSTERYLLKPSFAQTPEGRWLARNASRYGWKLTVVSGSRVIEPWHFRYFGSALGRDVAAGPPAESMAGRAAQTVGKPVRAAGNLLGRILGH
jgi:hypothetical protein